MKAGDKLRCPKCDKQVLARKQGGGKLYCNNCDFRLGEEEKPKGAK